MLDRDAFQEMSNAYKSPQDLFKALESTHISDLLLELVVDVKVENVDGSISFRELSEGEQQLLLVLGLLRFTKEDEALFLLDEPDTHLNPAWSVQYLNFIDQMVGSQQTSQIVMATHDPLVFGGLTKSQVNVLTWGSDRTQVIASKPVEDPRGMGIEAILTSDLFGLRAALDIPTLEDLDRRRRLVVKGDARNPQEQEDLKGLNEKLAGLDYSLDKTDPLFSLFMESMTKWEQEQGPTKTVLTKAEQEAQRDKALEIIRALKAKKPNTNSQSK
jgi:translation initiation factor RLI1